MAVNAEIPVMLIGVGGFYLGILSTASYLDVSLKQKAKDIPAKEKLALFGGGIAGAGAAAYVATKVIL